MTKTKRLLIFQHTPWERPGRFLLRAAKRLHVELSTVQLWRQSPPDFASYHGLIVLGGSPNVDQEDEHPFLSAEKKFIRRAIDNGMPYLGFCLGHQLLADALGVRVGPNACRGIGFVQGEITKDGRAHSFLKCIPRCCTLFKWHSQTVVPPLPKHIEVLITSADCEVESISVQGGPISSGSNLTTMPPPLPMCKAG